MSSDSLKKSIMYFSKVASVSILFIHSAAASDKALPGWYECSKNSNKVISCNDNSRYKRITDLELIGKLKNELNSRHSNSRRALLEDRANAVLEMTSTSGSEVRDRLSSLINKANLPTTGIESRLVASAMVKELIGNLKDARSAYESTLELSPENTEAKLRVALLDIKEKNVDAGKSLADMIKKNKIVSFETIGGRSASTYTVIADDLLIKKKDSEALAYYKKAMEYNKDDTYSAGRYAQLLLAASNGSKEKIKEAKEILEKVPDDFRFSETKSLIKRSLSDGFEIEAFRMRDPSREAI